MDFSKRYEGTVKFYSREKAYGFVYVYDLEGEEKSIFFHKSHLRNGLIPPTDGDKVNFDIREGDRGLYCEDVVIGEIGDNDE